MLKVEHFFPSISILKISLTCEYSSEAEDSDLLFEASLLFLPEEVSILLPEEAEVVSLEVQSL
jgi:hypothetical protein